MKFIVSNANRNDYSESSSQIYFDQPIETKRVISVFTFNIGIHKQVHTKYTSTLKTSSEADRM